jgi:hypothetical protein
LVWVGCLALVSSGGQPERSWVDVLLAAGRYLLLFVFLSMIVLGWPLVWLTDWPKGAKVLACAVLAVVAVGGRIRRGWEDQPSPSVQVPDVHNERLDRHVDLPPPRR